MLCGCIRLLDNHFVAPSCLIVHVYALHIVYDPFSNRIQNS
jgi:hypothetical protein